VAVDIKDGQPGQGLLEGVGGRGNVHGGGGRMLRG
jgi:hypothetical protein